MALVSWLLCLATWTYTVSQLPRLARATEWGAQVQDSPHTPWGEAAVSPQKTAAAGPNFYLLPMFQHAPSPVVAPEIFLPLADRKPFPTAINKLLFPEHQQQNEPTPVSNPHGVAVWCGHEKVFVRLDLSQLGFRFIPSLFKLGSCPASSVTPRFLHFHSGLAECHGSVRTHGNQLVYSNTLHYTPPYEHIIRALPLHLPIHCHYNRYHYSYKIGYIPRMIHRTFLKSIKSRRSFSLTVCNDQWQPASSHHWFPLGEPVNFIAQTGTLSAGERLYVDYCYATASTDPYSQPKIDIISNYGCMLDSRRSGSRSQFLPAWSSVVKFTVDAFLLPGVTEQVLYLHCAMSVGSTPSPTAKSCNFNYELGRWEEREAPPYVCSCCDSVCGDKQLGEVSISEAVKSLVSTGGWNVRGWEMERNGRKFTKMRITSAEMEEDYGKQEKKNKEAEVRFKGVKIPPDLVSLEEEVATSKEKSGKSLVPAEEKLQKNMTKEGNTMTQKGDVEDKTMKKGVGSKEDGNEEVIRKKGAAVVISGHSDKSQVSIEQKEVIKTEVKGSVEAHKNGYATGSDVDTIDIIASKGVYTTTNNSSTVSKDELTATKIVTYMPGISEAGSGTNHITTSGQSTGNISTEEHVTVSVGSESVSEFKMGQAATSASSSSGTDTGKVIHLGSGTSRDEADHFGSLGTDQTGWEEFGKKTDLAKLSVPVMAQGLLKEFDASTTPAGVVGEIHRGSFGSEQFHLGLQGPIHSVTTVIANKASDHSPSTSTDWAEQLIRMDGEWRDKRLDGWYRIEDSEERMGTIRLYKGAEGQEQNMDREERRGRKDHLDKVLGFREEDIGMSTGLEKEGMLDSWWGGQKWQEVERLQEEVNRFLLGSREPPEWQRDLVVEDSKSLP